MKAGRFLDKKAASYSLWHGVGWKLCSNIPLKPPCEESLDLIAREERCRLPSLFSSSRVAQLSYRGLHFKEFKDGDYQVAVYDGCRHFQKLLFGREDTSYWLESDKSDFYWCPGYVFRMNGVFVQIRNGVAEEALT
mmetsp:Transcript_36792/g.56338  ORF Transcript_36792/g.56338 Transcript_36792/m.56338 type:complete len:136 (-) Transcript_36792:31-438(-)